MAIVPMTCFSLMIPKQNKERLLRHLQRFGDVHFKHLSPDQEGFLRNVPEESIISLENQRDQIRQYIAEIERFEKATSKLLSPRDRRDLIKRDINVDTMTYEELEQRAGLIDIVSLMNSMDELEALHEGETKSETLYYIEPWAQNKLKDSVLIEIRDAEPIIGTVSVEFEREFTEDIRNTGQIYAIIRKETDGNILFILKPSIEQLENAEIFAQKYHMKRRSAKAVHMDRAMLAFRHKVDIMISRRNRTDGSLEKVARRKLDLMVYYEYLENVLLRMNQSKKFVQTDAMVIIEGWIPTNSAQEFQSAVEEACAGVCVLRLENAAKNAVETPVKLQNNRFTAAFESVTKMYATPRYNEVDPTPIFAPFYMLFFGMMLADVGYGLLMLVVMLLALRLFNLKPSTKKMAQFLFYLSFATMLWGAVYGSFFSGTVPMTPLINPNTEYNRVLIMALGFGVLHLVVGLGVKAYIYIRDGYALYALFDIGFWYMVLLSGVVLVAQFMAPTLVIGDQNVFMAIMIVGMVGILLTNGRSARTPPGKLALGLYNLYGLTNYVSDIVSYSRLMALGLAGGSIGIAINMIVGMVSKSGVIGIIFGALIFIGFNIFNLLISGLSAYVHSSRLIYVEFFGKFFTGGGEEFIPFRAKHTYINVI